MASDMEARKKQRCVIEFLHMGKNCTLRHLSTLAERLPPHSAHIHCLVSVNVQQESINVNGCIFFPHMEEFNDTRLLFTHLHVIRHLVRLSPCCHLAYGNKTYGILEGRFNLYCH